MAAKSTVADVACSLGISDLSSLLTGTSRTWRQIRSTAAACAVSVIIRRVSDVKTSFTDFNSSNSYMYVGYVCVNRPKCVSEVYGRSIIKLSDGEKLINLCSQTISLEMTCWRCPSMSRLLLYPVYAQHSSECFIYFSCQRHLTYGT